MRAVVLVALFLGLCLSSLGGCSQPTEQTKPKKDVSTRLPKD
jgi:hypothetical protein